MPSDDPNYPDLALLFSGDAQDNDPEKQCKVADWLCKGSRAVKKQRDEGCAWYWKAFQNANKSMQQHAVDKVEYHAQDRVLGGKDASTGSTRAKELLDEYITDLTKRAKEHDWSAQKVLAQRHLDGKYAVVKAGSSIPTSVTTQNESRTVDLIAAVDWYVDACESGVQEAWQVLHRIAKKGNPAQSVTTTTESKIVLHEFLHDCWNNGRGDFPSDRKQSEKERTRVTKLKTKRDMELQQIDDEANADDDDFGLEAMGGDGL